MYLIKGKGRSSPSPSWTIVKSETLSSGLEIHNLSMIKKSSWCQYHKLSFSCRHVGSALYLMLQSEKCLKLARWWVFKCESLPKNGNSDSISHPHFVLNPIDYFTDHKRWVKTTVLLYSMASEVLEYRVQVIWTPFMVFFSHFGAIPHHSLSLY